MNYEFNPQGMYDMSAAPAPAKKKVQQKLIPFPETPAQHHKRKNFDVDVNVEEDYEKEAEEMRSAIKTGDKIRVNGDTGVIEIL